MTLDENLRNRIDREYGFVTLCLPNAIHDWFLAAIERGELQEGTGFEDFLSRMIIDMMKAREPALELPELLAYEHEAYEGKKH